MRLLVMRPLIQHGPILMCGRSERARCARRRLAAPSHKVYLRMRNPPTRTCMTFHGMNHMPSEQPDPETIIHTCPRSAARGRRMEPSHPGAETACLYLLGSLAHHRSDPQ